MTRTIRDSHSNLHISDEVISTIARCATKEIEGVEALVADTWEWRSLLFHPRIPNAIMVELFEGVAHINVSISMKYGYRLSDVAQKIQTAVKGAVQNMTGIKVGRVNVHVADIVYMNGENQ